MQMMSSDTSRARSPNRQRASTEGVCELMESEIRDGDVARDGETAAANENEDVARDIDNIQVLPMVALRDTVIFPEMIVPLQVGRDRSVKALDRAVRTSS